MPHPFELRKEIEVDASPEDVWQAISTGHGVDGWYIDTGNEVEPGVGGTYRVSFGGGASSAHTITTWEPPHRLASHGEPGPDGVAHAMEYVIEARAGGRTLIRMVHSGFLADDWEAEYDALNEGDFMYLHQLGQYVRYFLGRPVTLVTAVRPHADAGDARGRLLTALGLSAEPKEGAPVRLQVEGVPPVDGTVDFVSPNIVGVRASDALYRFLIAMRFVYLGHHVYREGVDRAAESAAWETWLEQALT